MKKELSINSHNSINKENIAKAISIIFDSKNALPDYIKKMLLERLLWANTEHNNQGSYQKYFGQPYWSKGALYQLASNLGKRINNPKHRIYQDLRHEHSIPKRIIRELILKNKVSKDETFKILNTYGHAAVISKDEDGSLNAKRLRTKMAIPIERINSMEEVFSRYKEADIQICDVRNLNVMQLTVSDIDKLYPIT